MQLVQELSTNGYAVATVCRTLEIPLSTYYRQRQKADHMQKPHATYDDVEVLEFIKTLKLRKPAWGYRRVKAFIVKKLQRPVNRKRVYRLMRQHDLLVKVQHHRARRTPQREKPHATQQNEWWGTDMTKFYVNTVGWVYLVVVLDWYTRKIVGHALGLRPTTQLWLQAMEQAVQSACPRGSRAYDLHLMTDNGSQPTSRRFENYLATLGIIHVTTSYSNPKGNADTERVIRTIKEDAIWPNDFDSYMEAEWTLEQGILEYNTENPHSALGYLTPAEFEQNVIATAA